MEHIVYKKKIMSRISLIGSFLLLTLSIALTAYSSTENPAQATVTPDSISGLSIDSSSSSCLLDSELLGGKIVPMNTCPQSLCSNDLDCASACPSGVNPRCNNGLCAYDPGGNNGGGNPPNDCSSCPDTLCFDDSHCQGICSQAMSATCSPSGTCSFSCD